MEITAECFYRNHFLIMKSLKHERKQIAIHRTLYLYVGLFQIDYY